MFRLGLVVLALCGVASASGAGAPLAPEVILERMEQRFEQQLSALDAYQGRRRYSVTHRLLSTPAYWLVKERFSAPDEKQFDILERGGSSIVQNQVFARLLKVEQETARDAVRPQVDLTRKNYDFTFVRYDEKADAYVFQVSPRGTNRYLLRGMIWVNAQDFAVQRIEGEPSMKHSALIRNVRFVHEFARFGEHWFPVRHRSVTELRLLGTATLEIDYFDYHWQTRTVSPARGQEQGGLR